MKRLGWMLLSLCLGQVARAQDAASDNTEKKAEKLEFAENVVSLEALGRAVLYSLNYDRLVTPNVAVGAGFSYFSASATTVDAGLETNKISVSAVIFPLYANYYFQTTEHRPFVTGGLDLVFGSVSGGDADDVDFTFEGTGVAGVIGGGYEYRTPGEGFVFRAAPYLLVGTGGVRFWFGASFGLSF